jgi:tetratricopeptide (TPR) repeat protein
VAVANDQTADFFDALGRQFPWAAIKTSYSGKAPGLPCDTQANNPVLEEVRRLNDTGLSHYRSGRLPEAAECYSRGLALLGDNPVGLYTLGVISGQLNQYEKSKENFERLVRVLESCRGELDPEVLATAHQGIGAALVGLWATANAEDQALHLAQRAELEFRRATELKQDYLQAWLGLGVALHILERLDDAESAFRSALEIDPDNQPAVERLRSVLEDKLERRLFELGYLSKINKPIRNLAPYENRSLIEVKGKPLSETIIEERR